MAREKLRVPTRRFVLALCQPQRFINHAGVYSTSECAPRASSKTLNSGRVKPHLSSCWRRGAHALEPSEELDADLSVTLRKALIVGASATAMTMAPASAWADLFDLDYSGADGISGMFVLTAVPDPGAGSGAFLVTSISGTQNGLSGTLIPPPPSPAPIARPASRAMIIQSFPDSRHSPI